MMMIRWLRVRRAQTELEGETGEGIEEGRE
jgi:hypothetical protein